MLEVCWYDRNVKTGPGCEGIQTKTVCFSHSELKTFPNLEHIKKRVLCGLETLNDQG